MNSIMAFIPQHGGRVSVRDVDAAIDRLRGKGCNNVRVDHNLQGWRLVEERPRLDADGIVRSPACRDLSPRLPTRQFCEWLDSFTQGFEHGVGHARSSGNMSSPW